MASDASVFDFAVQLGKPKNRFVAGIALLAGLGGFLFGFDTGVAAGRPAGRRRLTGPGNLVPDSESFGLAILAGDEVIVLATEASDAELGPSFTAPHHDPAQDQPGELT